MTITASQTNSVDRALRIASGSHTDDAAAPAAIAVTCGFQPRYVRVVNLTTRVEYEFFAGMTATHALKTVAAGTRTAETSAGITLTSTGFSAPAPAQNDVVYWIALG